MDTAAKVEDGLKEPMVAVRMPTAISLMATEANTLDKVSPECPSIFSHTKTIDKDVDEFKMAAQGCTIPAIGSTNDVVDSEMTWVGSKSTDPDILNIYDYDTPNSDVK